MKELIPYTTKTGNQPVIDWLESLDKVTRSRITSRFTKIQTGNYGLCESVGTEIRELKYMFGAGYRVYFAEDDGSIVVLLIGGDKSTQKRDIKKAHEYWDDYKLRKSGD